KPLALRYVVRASHPLGAYPTPNSSAAVESKPRSARNCRPVTASGDCSCDAKNSAASLLASTSRLRWPCCLGGPLPPSSYRSCTPALPASRSTASVNVRWSIFMTKEMTSPPSPQPKQWKYPRAGLTWNDGVFSSWNGQRPFSEPPPAFLSWTYCSTIDPMGD